MVDFAKTFLIGLIVLGGGSVIGFFFWMALDAVILALEKIPFIANRLPSGKIDRAFGFMVLIGMGLLVVAAYATGIAVRIMFNI